MIPNTYVRRRDNTSVREWNADTYHRVSNPQFEWGLPVLARLPLRGDELVLDVGCGTGRLTDKLLDRLPLGRGIGIDPSENMLTVAREYLRPRHGGRVTLVRADASALPVFQQADAIFSTATFHWILDHQQLFRSLHAALKPGGLLVAQCGGKSNLQRVHERAATLMLDADFAPHFANWQEPWEFADATTTEQRLRGAGFVDIRTTVEWSPVVQPTADAYAVFLANVICRPHLSHLPDDDTRRHFIDRLTRAAIHDTPAFELDYWRLNVAARKAF